MIKIFVIIFSFLALVVVALSIYLQPDSFSLCPNNGIPSTRQGCTPVDAIIAISGGDTTARTNHAVELYKEGWAPLLIFSGAAQDKSGPSNALAMRQTALDAGVPASAIIIEEHAENTEENASNTNRLLELKNVKRIILVTSGYHQRRASLEFHRMLDDNITIQNSPTSDKDWGWFWWLTPRGWWLAVGEFVKIIAFYAGAH
jgi:uncharacterized SAM-binding protein YcdF (DUF218 family)